MKTQGSCHLVRYAARSPSREARQGITQSLPGWCPAVARTTRYAAQGIGAATLVLRSAGPAALPAPGVAGIFGLAGGRPNHPPPERFDHSTGLVGPLPPP